MPLPPDNDIKRAVLKTLNLFLRARVPGNVDLTELPEELPEGFLWSLVAQELGLEERSARSSLRKRYVRNLAPGLVLGNWQPDEDDLIYRMRALGKGWVEIAKMLKGRSALAITNR